MTGLVAALGPAVPRISALDPTPVPNTDAIVSSAPSADVPSVDPSAAATPDPSLSPTPDPRPSASGAVPSVDPSAAATPDPSPSASDGVPSASPDPSTPPLASPTASTTPTQSPLPGLRVTHTWIDTVDVTGAVTASTALDQDLVAAERFHVYRVRMQVSNDANLDATLIPALEARVAGVWEAVPQDNPVIGQPFYAASDDGKTFKDRQTVIATRNLRLSSDGDPSDVAFPGVSIAGDNPAAAVTIPARGFTEIEFAFRATVGAAWNTTYSVRITDLSGTLPTAGTTHVAIGSKPALDLSPGQRAGDPVADAAPLYKLAWSGPVVQARLAITSMPTVLATSSAADSPHMNYTLTTDACAACHTAHQGKNQMILRGAAPQSNLCFQCHDGSGATSNVQAQFTSSKVPANDPSTASFYRHPATQASTHISDRGPEFAGVLNRHSECSDCHQPHAAVAAAPTDTAAGWTAPGAVSGAAGVSVLNGGAGSSPTYTLLTTVSLEYQLCFKCHSGYTTLPTRDAAHPSWTAVDKAVELNPANVSYHPVEAAGRNQSTAMAQSLSGTSPSKVWAFSTGSTIRCQNCHGNPSAIATASPPAASVTLDNHASSNRGMLIAVYRDRTLLASNDLYDPGRFSLCYVCHAEAPMVDNSGDPRTDSNFNWHGFHLNSMFYTGAGGTEIDTAGAGQGNALCAECHFRIHGDALAVNGQAPAKGLVNFAPDVQPANGVIRFVPATPTVYGSCTLTCHGRTHVNLPYAYGTLP